MKPTAHLLHGFIGCGKTSFARKLERKLPALRLTHDEWMACLYGQNPPEERFAEFHARIDELIWKLACQALHAGIDVIIDCGFWTRESRDAARERVSAAGGQPKFHSVACPEAVMRQRTLERSKHPPPDSLWIDENAFDKLKAGFEAMQDDEAYQWVDGT